MTHSADAVIIGAGMAGACVAADLASRGWRVILLEGEAQPGYHATGRSAAIFSETYGGPWLRALARAGKDFFIDPPAGFADQPLTTPHPTLHIAHVDSTGALEAFTAQDDMAAATRPLAAAEVIALCPVLRPQYAQAGLLETSSRDIDVHVLHQAYLMKLREHGGEVRSNAPVSSLERREELWRVETPAGTVSAPIVVNAAGAWAAQIAALAGAIPIELAPLRRTAVLIDAPPGFNIAPWPFVADVEGTFYFKPDAGRLMLSPADEIPSAPCDAQAEELEVAIAVDRFQNATTVEVRHVRHRWAGLRTFAPDRAPLIGFDPGLEGFFWVAALGGYGIQSAPAVSELAGSLIVGEPISRHLAAHGVDASAFAPGRFAAS